MDDKELPVYKLNYNITQFFSMITNIDINDAIKAGLKNEIVLAEKVDGNNINACCSSEGQVYLSPKFAQAVWNMCYAGLKLADYNLSEVECNKEGTTLDELYVSVLKSGCTLPECLYIRELHDAKDWELMIEEAIVFRRKWAVEQDYDLMAKMDISNAFGTRVNGMYMAGMGGILLHELTHFYKDHWDKKGCIDQRDLEMDADNVSFEALLALPIAVRRSAVLGSLCSYLLAFFNNKDLKSVDSYYREDIRLFTQFDKIVDKDCKRRADVIVAYVLSRWLKKYHNIDIPVIHDHEEDAVLQIRKELKRI